MPSPTKRIVIINGHPDSSDDHLIHGLVSAYEAGARQSGHGVDIIAVGKLNFPFLRTAAEFEHGSVPDAIRDAQHLIAQADHLVVAYPLWLGAMPALLKAFFEQVLRPGFAFTYQSKGLPKKLLAGKTARIIVTMGMPSFVYRWYFMAHSVKSLKRNILEFIGVRPVRTTLLGMLGDKESKRTQRWLLQMTKLGATAK